MEIFIPQLFHSLGFEIKTSGNQEEQGKWHLQSEGKDSDSLWGILWGKFLFIGKGRRVILEITL